jgi:hypothetical protein
MHGILKALHELFEVRDPGLERTQLIVPGSGRGRSSVLGRPAGGATELANAGDQPIMLGHGSLPI